MHALFAVRGKTCKQYKKTGSNACAHCRDMVRRHVHSQSEIKLETYIHIQIPPDPLFNAVSLWLLQIKVPFKCIIGVFCSYCMCGSSCHSSVRDTLKGTWTAVTTVVLPNMRSM